MKPIKIKYYPTRLKLALTAKGNLPENWEEITPQQIIAIGCTVNGSISDVAFLSALTGISKWVIKRLDNYQRFQLSESLNFFSASKLHNAFAIPFVQHKLTKYYTPKPKLKGMSFGQFIFVDTWFGSYQHENNAANLHSFIAALCIANRQQFNENDIERNAPKMAKLKPDVKEALLINYMLIRAWLMKVYPLVFPEPEENTATVHEQPQKTYDSSAWLKIYEGMVGDDITNDKYEKLPVHTALRYLSKNIKANLKNKK